MLPWADMLRAATRLNISPVEFWQLSLVEWRWAIGQTQDAALSGPDLSALMTQFPDSSDNFEE